MVENGIAMAAEALVAAGRNEEGKRQFRRALDRNSADARAAYGLARLLLAGGELHDAVEVTEQALAHNPHDLKLLQLPCDLGLALYRANMWEDAEPWLARGTAQEPWNTGLAAAYARAKRPDYLQPEIFDPLLNRQLRRYAAREGNTYIYVVDVVGTCNLRCPTCPVGNSPARPKGFMELDLFERIVAKICREAPAPHPIVNLYNWGEPLLHPNLPAMLKILREAGLRSQLSSNLNIKHGLEAVIAANPDELKISLSGFSQETYGRAHARGKLALVKKNMRLVRDYADKHRATTKIWVGHHIYRSNQHHVEPVRRLCNELGFAYHPMNAFYMPLERVLDAIDGRPNPRDGGILEDLLRHPTEIQRLAAQSRSGRFDCELRFNQTVINHDGTVALCCTVYDKANMLGVSFLEEDFAALERRKYNHPFCRVCMDNNLQYAPPELNPRRAGAGGPRPVPAESTMAAVNSAERR